jgi:hypothetical protein
MRYAAHRINNAKRRRRTVWLSLLKIAAPNIPPATPPRHNTASLSVGRVRLLHKYSTLTAERVGITKREVDKASFGSIKNSF